MLTKRGKSDSFIIQYIKWAFQSSSMYRYTIFDPLSFVLVPRWILNTPICDGEVIWDPTVIRFGNISHK